MLANNVTERQDEFTLVLLVLEIVHYTRVGIMFKKFLCQIDILFLDIIIRLTNNTFLATVTEQLDSGIDI